jgi:transcriptional regulator with GAF, ATPase, and Fis domain
MDLPAYLEKPSMQRFRTILLEVWREACKHIEIHESAGTIAGLLTRNLPLGSLIVRRFENGHGSILTVAISAIPEDGHAAEDRVELKPAQRKRVLQWCESSGAARPDKQNRSVLAVVLPPNLKGDIVALPLVNQGEVIGVIALVATAGKQFTKEHLELIEALREPFSVALDNDRRAHELATLREAAEAERGALLRKLGRTENSDVIVGGESGLRHVMDRVELVSDSDVPILILGETGTGKELIARAVHTRGRRSAGPFIRVNCGAIPAELIDAQLFGHERGSFTGAEQTRAGWFERADGGTLFLDEIGELPLEAQVRFLRVLQDGFVERVGGDHPLHVDVRIVAATHRDLAHMVRESKFREDLWYRLAVFPVILPPLRERRDDIGSLVEHFAQRAAVRFGLAAVSPSDEDIRILQDYDWPGNIRELGR